MKKEILKIVISGIIGIILGIASLFGISTLSSCHSVGSWDMFFNKIPPVESEVSK